MDKPKPPILLNYKTPEKGKRITAWMVIERTIVGSFGMLATFAAVVLSFTAIAVFMRGVYSNRVAPAEPQNERSRPKISPRILLPAIPIC